MSNDLHGSLLTYELDAGDDEPDDNALPCRLTGVEGGRKKRW